MTDSILRLNYWVLGDCPAHTFVVRLPNHYTVIELKQLILKDFTEPHDVDTERLRIWSVDIEIVTLEQIKDESHIKGMELVSRLTILSEVFLAQPDPDRINIIVSHPPKSALYALRALYEAAWNKPQSLVSQETVAYKIGEGESKKKTCDVFDLGEHAQRLIRLGFSLGRRLVITQEYKDAFQSIRSIFLGENPLRGFVVTGQPGIGKSLFLLYVLLKRMQEALPVALHISSAGYYLADGEGVSFHKNSSIDPLDTHQRIWCLSNSSVTTRVPPEGFLQSTAAQVIQAASPQEDRWHDWVKELSGGVYIMDTWDEGELALLASLQGGEESVSKMFQLSSEWGPSGPSPRHLMLALDTWANVSLACHWENSMTCQVAESQRKGIPENSEWKVIKIGYFTPLQMQGFAPVTESSGKGKGRAIEENSESKISEQPMVPVPSTSSAPPPMWNLRRLRQRNKRPKRLAAQPTSSSDATARAKKKPKLR